MLIFMNTPAMAMSLALHTLDEAGQESRPERRTAMRGRRRVARISDTNTNRRGSWLARSLHLAH